MAERLDEKIKVQRQVKWAQTILLLPPLENVWLERCPNVGKGLGTKNVKKIDWEWDWGETETDNCEDLVKKQTQKYCKNGDGGDDESAYF